MDKNTRTERYTKATAHGVSEEIRTKAISEFEQLLLDTNRPGIDRVITWIRRYQFYKAPASSDCHGNFEGGLLCHSLNTYHNALDGNKVHSLPHDSVVLCSLLHDVCKHDFYKFDNGKWSKDEDKEKMEGHGRRSLAILDSLGLVLNDEEKLAIRWHMIYHDSDLDGASDDSEYKLEYEKIKQESHPLLKVVHDADHKASRDELYAEKSRFFCPLSEIPVKPYKLAKEPKPYPFHTITRKQQGLSCVGIGNICLNQVVRRDCSKGSSYKDTTMLEEVGGGMGNVLCNLAHLGWDTYPMARLGDSWAARQIINDLERYGADTRMITTSEDGGTYIYKSQHHFDFSGVPENKYGRLVCHHGRYDIEGNYTQNARLVTVRKLDVVPLFSKLDCVPSVLFFDSGDAGCKEAARVLKDKGSVLFFEPTNRYDKYLGYCISLCDILKFSHESITDLRELNVDWSNKLVIQTLDSKGARFNLRNEGWHNVLPIDNDYVIDAEGAGDMTTAAFLNHLSLHGTLSVASMTTDMVHQALSEAMKYGSYCTSFLGAKAMWYHEPGCQILPDKRQYQPV